MNSRAIFFEIKESEIFSLRQSSVSSGEPEENVQSAGVSPVGALQEVALGELKSLDDV